MGAFLRVGYVVVFARSNLQTLLFLVRVVEQLYTTDRNIAGACNFLARIRLIAAQPRSNKYPHRIYARNQLLNLQRICQGGRRCSLG